MKTLVAGLVVSVAGCVGMAQAPASHTVVLHAARMLDVGAGRVVSPGEVLVVGERIVAAGTHVDRPAGVEVIDLGDRTLLPGLIDAHVHRFCIRARRICRRWRRACRSG
jgi:imidazolonepropionase-like amidohydrolase